MKDFLAGRSGCAGQGICGGCRVRITALADDRRETVSELACRAVIAAGSLVIDLPPAGDDENLQMDWRMTADCSPPAASYGLALDIGTTSLAAGLFDLANGQMVWAAGGLNRQAVLAADVISRIVVADRPGGLDELRQLLWRDSVRPLVGKLCALAGIAPDQIRAVAAAGNTVMSHIANNLSPHSLGQAPYRPVTLAAASPKMRCTSAGLTVSTRPRFTSHLPIPWFDT
ncbi:MAG: hypothetical protein N3A57_03930, partial [Negativicutes bacterium]|nr:hypothetical protein [Negativicutes bacterium]